MNEVEVIEQLVNNQIELATIIAESNRIILGALIGLAEGKKASAESVCVLKSMLEHCDKVKAEIEKSGLVESFKY